MCQYCQNREEGAFASLDDYRSHVTQVESDEAFIEVNVDSPMTNVGLVERWFKCQKCTSVWRLVEPDPPFSGVWKKVEMTTT